MLLVASSNDLEVSLKEFLVSMKQGDYSARTQGAYQWHLDRLLVWLAERGIISPRQVNRLLLREWGAGLYDHWQPATVKQALSACKAWFKWLHEERMIEDNPATALKLPSEKLRVHRTMRKSEVLQLVEACDISTDIGLRDRAIVSLLFDSGLRAAELCRLSLSNLDLTEREFIVRVKGGDEKPGWFGEVTTGYLEAWLRARKTLPAIHTVFIAIGGTRPGYPLTPGGLGRILKNIGKQATIPDVSPHAFRRGFALSLSDNGVPDDVLKDLGRWESTKQIKRYTQARQAKKIYPKFSPMDRNE